MSLIRTEKLSRIYNAGTGHQVVALDGASLQIGYGETVAIMGKSGSGKSTLLHILGCLDQPTSGKYWFDGMEIPWHKDRELARIRNKRIGFVFQEFALITGQTAWENVALPLIHAGVSFRKARLQAEEVLKKFGLHSHLEHRVEQLSGGQRQRVAIARAMVNEPDLILADEPTGALDTETGHEVMDLLLALGSAKRSVVVVTHDEEIASRCDRMIRIVDGRIEVEQRVGERLG